jgi:hypothetical protein
MVNPQPTDAHLRIAHSIEEEIMMRDFSKRQRSILDLILRLSWGCGKKTAIIPLQKDFEMVGIDQTKIKTELSWLVNAKVISWNQDEKEFSFNKNYDEWRVSIVIGYDKKRFSELLNLNLNTCQNGKLELAKTASNDNEKLAETASISMDGLDEKARNDLTKKQVPCGSNADDSMPEGLPKESSKEITITTTSLAPSARNEFSGRLPGAPESDIQSDRLPGASDEPDIVNDIANHYFKLTSRLANSRDYVSMTEVIDRPLAVPIDYKSKLEVIKNAMDRMSEQKKKIPESGPIKCFSYFRDGIFEEFKMFEVAHTPRQESDTKQYMNGTIDYRAGSKDKSTKKSGFKAPQAGNFEQRKYSDEYFESLFKNV